MNRLATTEVPGWTHDSLQGETITHANVPVHDFLTDNLTPVVIPTEHATYYEPSQTELFRVSAGHGRSYELGPNADRNAPRLGRVALWRDEYDNAYTSYSLKGNNFTHSTIIESATAPSGYIPMGLLESDALLRVIRSSRLLREAGISTEWINRVFEPQQLLYKGEAVSQDEYKRRLLIDTANTRGLEEMAKIATAIEPMTFFITGRSMEINDRLADFGHDTSEQAKKRLQRIFAIYNATHQEDDGYRRLQPAREGDRNRFFKEIFPTLLGTNLAKLHNVDLVHTFPTLSNVTILGGIIDLDSVRGVPLAMGDEPINAGDRANDVATLTDYDDASLEMKTLYKQLYRFGLTTQPWYFIHAQASLVDAYEASRQRLPRKKDRLIETMAISGANWYLSGSKAFAAYNDLAKRESRKALDNVWESLLSLVEKKWSDESMAKEARAALDVRLRFLTDKLQPGEELDLTKEMLQPAGDFFALDPNNLLRGFDDEFPHLAEQLDDSTELAQLRRYLPDRNARVRVLISVMRAAAAHVSREVAEDVGIDKIRAEILEILDQEIDAFLERLSPEDWQVLPHAIDGFTAVENVPASHLLIFEQKAIHAFEGIDCKELITSALNANIRVITQDSGVTFNPKRYIVPPETLVPRTTFSDGTGYRLTRLSLTDIDRETIATTYDAPGEQKITYAAMLCEDKENGGYVLFIEHDDPQMIKDFVEDYRL